MLAANVRWVLLLCGLMVPGSVCGARQEVPLKLEVQVNRLLVRAVVRDRQGRIVDDLGSRDFQVFDDNKLQTISNFTVERRGAPAAGAVAAAAPGESGPVPRVQRAPLRSVIFVFDDLHMNFDDLSRVQKAAETMLAGSLTASDVAAVVSLSGRTNSGLTQDRAKLLAAIKGLRLQNVYRLDSADCPSISYYQAEMMEDKHDTSATEAAISQVFNCSPGLRQPQDRPIAEKMAESAALRAQTVGRQDVQVTMSALKELVRATGTLPGQRRMVLISPGFLTMTREALSAQSEILDMATRAEVTISAMDARGLYTTEVSASERSVGSARTMQLQSEYRRSSATGAEDVMEELADATGGSYFHNSNDLNEGFRSLTAAPSCAYLLEIAIGAVKPDGKWHALKVKVDREGMQVQARRGFAVPKPEKSKK